MKFLFVTTADARGHLMRSHLLSRRLKDDGHGVEIWTTSRQGKEFLKGLGTTSSILSEHYSVQFDSAHNMLRSQTDAVIAKYLLYPHRLLKDLFKFFMRSRDFDLIVCDSFHPMLLVASLFPVGKKIIHIYGDNLRTSLFSNFEGRSSPLFSKIFQAVLKKMLDSSLAQICHTIPLEDEQTEDCHEKIILLPPPISSHQESSDPEKSYDLCTYLNPHFRDPNLKIFLDEIFLSTQARSLAVNENFADGDTWQSMEKEFQQISGRSKFLISGLGMATLQLVAETGVPFMAIMTDQPEQRANLVYLERFKSPYLLIDLKREPLSAALKVKILNFIQENWDHERKGTLKSVPNLNRWTDLLITLAQG